MSMAARGYGISKRTSIVSYRFRASDALFLTLNALMTIAVIVLVALGATQFSYYPYISSVFGGEMATGAYVLFAAQSALLLLQEVKEETIWKFSRSKI